MIHRRGRAPQAGGGANVARHPGGPCSVPIEATKGIAEVAHLLAKKILQSRLAPAVKLLRWVSGDQPREAGVVGVCEPTVIPAA